MRIRSFIFIILILISLLGSVFFSPLQAKRLVESMQLAGGSTTIFSRSFAAFELPAEGLTDQELKRHMDTDPLFDRSHIPLNDHKNAGLGPLHNAKSCSACHVLNGRGRAVLGESLFRISLNKDKGDKPVPGMGFQLQDRATFGYEPEASVVREWIEKEKLRKLQTTITTSDGKVLPSDDVARSLRIPPPLIGLGLLEAIPEKDILMNEDINDENNDGISGKAVHTKDENGIDRLGRFGWKATSATLHQQTVDAYNEDMGITTPTGPDTNKTKDGMPADISWEELDGVTYYSQTLAAPATAQKADTQLVKAGFKVFNELKCASCHIAKQQTGFNSNAVAGVINNQTIWPYTDLLVHDMGPDLDDGVAEHGLSETFEWRTTPLWGLGLTKRVNHYVGFLHDGRARTIDEAILWHGGEAEESKNQYLSLNSAKKSQLLKWLKQL